MSKERLFVSPEHIAGVSNVLADALSRDRVISTEWALSKETFRAISRAHPDMEVDLFATRDNRQLPLFVSPFQDPKAIATDAFRVDWNRWRSVYLYPPTCLILKALDKLRSFRGKAVMIAPFWPTSPFFMPLKSLARRATPIRSPVLLQYVGGRRVFCDFCKILNLHVWSF